MFSNNNAYQSPSEDSDNGSDDIPRLIPVRDVRQSFIGQIRTCGTVSCMEWSFIVLSFTSIISGCAFNIYRMSTLSADQSDEYVFAVVVLLNLLFCVWYLLHGVFQEQPFEILMFVITSILLSLLITLNYASNEKVPPPGHLKLIRLIITLLLTLPNAVLGLIVGWHYWDSGRLVFKTVGADIRLQRMCRTMFSGMSLLAFDAQAFLSCIVLFVEGRISEWAIEDIVIISTGVTFTLIWLTIGYSAIRMESMPLVWLFFLASVAQPVYSIYLLVEGLHDIVENYSTIRTNSIFVAGTALVTAHFSLLATFTVITSNFGKGLRSAVYGYDEPERTADAEAGIISGPDSSLPTASTRRNYGSTGNLLDMTGAS